MSNEDAIGRRRIVINLPDDSKNEPFGSKESDGVVYDSSGTPVRDDLIVDQRKEPRLYRGEKVTFEGSYTPEQRGGVDVPVLGPNQVVGGGPYGDVPVLSREEMQKPQDYGRFAVDAFGRAGSLYMPLVLGALGVAGLSGSSNVTQYNQAGTSVAPSGFASWKAPVIFGLSYALTGVFKDAFDRAISFYEGKPSDQLLAENKQLDDLALNKTYMSGLSSEERLKVWGAYVASLLKLGKFVPSYPYLSLDSPVVDEGTSRPYDVDGQRLSFNEYMRLLEFEESQRYHNWYMFDRNRSFYSPSYDEMGWYDEYGSQFDEGDEYGFYPVDEGLNGYGQSYLNEVQDDVSDFNKRKYRRKRW